MSDADQSIATTPAEHSVALTSDFLTPGWVAECSCGWESPRHIDISDAERDFDRHRSEAKVSPR